MSARLFGAALLAAVLSVLVPVSDAARADYADAFQAEKAERQMRLLRRAGWREHDVLAQAELCRRYSDSEDTRADPIEAYVWCYLASVNLRIQGVADVALERFLDDVEMATLRRAQMFKRLSTRGRSEAFERVTYIMTCRGGVGFARLAELYDPTQRRAGLVSRRVQRAGGSDRPQEENGEFVLFGHFRDGFSRDPRNRSSSQGSGRLVSFADDGRLEPNAVEALTFYLLAERGGHPYAGAMRQALEASLTEDAEAIRALAAERAGSWLPPYEIYADGALDAQGNPYTDECPVTGAWEIALNRVNNLRHKDIQSGLAALRYYTDDIDNTMGPNTRNAIKDFQTANFWYPSGYLQPYETAQLIRQAAVAGDVHSQTTLGYMYACGIGVAPDEYRAVRWYERAYRQRSALAAYNLGLLLQGDDVNHQCTVQTTFRKVPENTSLSDAYFTDAVRWGFRSASDQVLQRIDLPVRER